MRPYTPRQPQEPYSTTIHNNMNFYCESNLQQFLDTVLLFAAMILNNSIYFKTSWIQQYNINHLQKTQDIKDISQKHKLTQHCHIH